MNEAKTAVLPQDWLSLEETKAALGVSLRTVQKLAKGQHLRFKRQPRPGKGPERIYSAADVARLREERPSEEPRPSEERPRAAVARRAKAERAQPEESPTLLALVRMGLDAQRIGLDVREKMAEVEAARLEFDREIWRREALHKKGWLTPAECARGWGLPSRTVIELAEGGQLAGLRCGRSWRIRRASLEAFAG